MSGGRSDAVPSGTVVPSQVTPCVASSAPGKVPNIESKVWFSLITKTMCLILPRALAIFAALAKVAGSVAPTEGDRPEAVDDGRSTGRLRPGPQAARINAHTVASAMLRRR